MAANRETLQIVLPHIRIFVIVIDTEIFIESKVVEHEILKIKCLRRFALRRFVTELSAIQNLDGGAVGNCTHLSNGQRQQELCWAP